MCAGEEMVYISMSRRRLRVGMPMVCVLDGVRAWCGNEEGRGFEPGLHYRWEKPVASDMNTAPAVRAQLQRSATEYRIIQQQRAICQSTVATSKMTMPFTRFSIVLHHCPLPHFGHPCLSVPESSALTPFSHSSISTPAETAVQTPQSLRQNTAR